MARTGDKQEATGAKGAADDPGAPGFLEDKLRIPRPSFPVLRRSRVSSLLEEAARHRVTLVCGPAGAGKTVACAAWAAAAPSRRRVAWLTADAEDRQEWFWAYLCASLSRTRVATPEAVRVLSDGPADRFPLRLIAAAQAFPEPVVLVLDDLHELADPAVLTGIDLLIRHAPPSLRLVLSARQQPPLQLARLRLAGDVADISGADLACTPEEADAYFAMLGLQVDPTDRAELLHRTRGWMAGLRLAAMRAQPPAAGKVTALAGDEPIVTDYLWDEVLGRQHPRIRQFLLRTSITEGMCGELADVLTGHAGGARTLERLSRENTLVEPLGNGHGEYRYHPLLRDALTAEVYRQIPDEVPALLRRAARWYGEHGRALDAVTCAAGAGDWDFAAQTLADAGIEAVLAPGPAELEIVLARFPAGWAAGDAAVAASWAAARLWSDDPEGAGAYLETAQHALAGTDPARRLAVEATVAALRLLQAGRSQGPDGSLARQARSLAEGGQASAASRGEHRALGLLWFALGVTALRELEIAAARHALRQADRQFSAAGLGGFRARARAWRALAEAWHGDLTTARRCADEVRKGLLAGPGAADGQSPAPLAQQAACLVSLAYAQLSLAQDDLVTAQRLLDETDAARAGRWPGEPDVTEVAVFIQARILLADGDPAGARAALSRLREARAAASPAISDLLAVAEAEAAVQAGDTGRARALLLLTEPPAGGWQTGPCLPHGWLLVAAGEFGAALDAVRPCLEPAGGAPVTLRERIVALLVAAVASRRLGKAADATNFLEEALSLAEPHRAYRVFLDGGPAVRSALTVLIPPTSRYAGFAGRVLERFDAQGGRPAGPPAEPAVRLTDSERAVLCFLPSHMTNEEISEALFLSINTVKTHLRSAYRKLGVGSRREAIARGRRLGVL